MTHQDLRTAKKSADSTTPISSQDRSSAPAASLPTQPSHTDSLSADSEGVRTAMAQLLAMMKEPAPPSVTVVQAPVRMLLGKELVLVDDKAEVLTHYREVFSESFGASVSTVHFGAGSNMAEIASQMTRAALLVFDFDLNDSNSKETGLHLFAAVKARCALEQLSVPPLIVYSGRLENKSAVEAAGGTFILKGSSLESIGQLLLEKFPLQAAS